MRKIFSSRSAMTLTELIVASALVGIVTLGLISAEYTVRMARQSSARDNLLTTQMQAQMLLISRDAAATVGNYADTGIFLWNNPMPTVYLKAACFRYAFGDVNSYADDRWACWTFDMDTHTLLRCDNLIVGPVTDCNGYQGTQNWSIVPYGKLGVGLELNDGSVVNPLTYAGFITNQSIRQINIRMIARYNTNKPYHPIENPSYQTESSISPVGLSR